MGLGGEGVLVRAADAKPGLVPLGRRAHGDAVEPADEAVPVKGVGERRRAVLDAVPAAGQQVRRVRHRLGTASDDDLAVAGRDLRGRLGDRGQPGQAELVDRDRGHAHRDSAGGGAQPRRVRPDAGLDNGAEDHGVDLVPGDP